MRDISELLKIFNEKTFSYEGNDVYVKAEDMIAIEARDTVRLTMMFEHPEGEIFKEAHYIDRFMFVSQIEQVAEMIQTIMHGFALKIREWEQTQNIDEFEEEEI